MRQRRRNRSRTSSSWRSCRGYQCARRSLHRKLERGELELSASDLELGLGYQSRSPDPDRGQRDMMSHRWSHVHIVPRPPLSCLDATPPQPARLLINVSTNRKPGLNSSLPALLCVKVTDPSRRRGGRRSSSDCRTSHGIFPAFTDQGLVLFCTVSDVLRDSQGTDS